MPPYLLARQGLQDEVISNFFKFGPCPLQSVSEHGRPRRRISNLLYPPQAQFVFYYLNIGRPMSLAHALAEDQAWGAPGGRNGQNGHDGLQGEILGADPGERAPPSA